MERPELLKEMADKLEDFEHQYGVTAGKLALAMDLMSDSEIAVGQLGLYCRNNLDPRKPHPDLEALQKYLQAVRILVKEAFREEQKRKKEEK